MQIELAPASPKITYDEAIMYCMFLEYAPVSPKISYDEAVMYCFFCNYNGHRDWRMPTGDEYSSTSKIYGWYFEDPGSRTNKKYPVVPVRTKHDS